MRWASKRCPYAASEGMVTSLWRSLADSENLEFNPIADAEINVMKKMSFLVLIILFFPVVLFAQEKIEGPIWIIQDKWEFKRRPPVVVVNADESSFTVKSGTSIYIYERSSLNILYSVEGGRRLKYTGRHKRLFNFPLEIGKSWKDTFVARPTHDTTLGDAENIYYETYTVLGSEDIIVEAGKFRAIKFEYKQEGMGRGWSWVGKAWYWYSPDAKYLVKCQYENSPVWIGIYGWELTSFRLKK